MSAIDGLTTGPGADIFPSTIEPYLGAVVFETFLYGLYVVLFLTCVFLLVRRRHKIHWLLRVLGLATFILASVDMGYTIWLLFGKLLKGDLSYQVLRLKYWFYVTNNVFADTLLLYRCYVVWNFDKRILFGPAILLVAATVCGYILEGSSSATLLAQSWVYLLMTTILNIILTGLTASRIWFVSRRATMSVDPALLHKYHVTFSILIESGFVYCLYMILDLAFHTNPTGSIVLDAGLVQVVGIMPTLILAQVGLGRTTQDVEANYRTSHIEMSTVIDSTVDSSGKRPDALLRWKVASGLPSPSKGNFVAKDHDPHHHLRSTDEHGQVNNQRHPHDNKLEPVSVELEDNQRIETDVVNACHQTQIAQPHGVARLTPNRPAFLQNVK